MTCPDPERLTGFVDDTLGVEDRAAIEEHLDACEDCRSSRSAQSSRLRISCKDTGAR